MDKFDIAQEKVKKYEQELETLNDEYYNTKSKLEKSWKTFEDRRNAFNLMTEMKYEQALADFRREGVDDYSEFNHLVEGISEEVQSGFSQIFRQLNEKIDQLDSRYQKLSRQINDKLDAAYRERQKAYLDYQEKKGK